MNLIRRFFSFEYYTAILQGKERFRPFLIALALAVLLSIKPSFFVYKDISPAVKNLESKAIALINEIYPTELEIKIKKGTASTNVTEPYYIIVRKEILENILSLEKDSQGSSSKVRLFAIDTKGKAEAFEQYQSLALLTENSVVYYKDEKINIYPLRDIQDMTINKEIITNKVKEINKQYNISNLVNIGVLVSPLLIILGIFISQLSLFSLLSLAVYIMIKINQIPAGFKNTFRYTTAIALIPILLWNAVTFIPQLAFNLEAAGSLLGITILVIAYLGIEGTKSQQA